MAASRRNSTEKRNVTNRQKAPTVPAHRLAAARDCGSRSSKVNAKIVRFAQLYDASNDPRNPLVASERLPIFRVPPDKRAPLQFTLERRFHFRSSHAAAVSALEPASRVCHRPCVKFSRLLLIAAALAFLPGCLGYTKFRATNPRGETVAEWTAKGL